MVCRQDFLLLRYMWHRGALRIDINEECVFCKTEDNGIEMLQIIVLNLRKKEKKL